MKTNIQCLDEENIKYFVHKGRYKRVSLRIKDGGLIINIPYGIDLIVVERFIKSKMDLIKKHLQIENNNYIPSYQIFSIYHLLGESYKISFHQDKKTYVDEIGKVIYVNHLDSVNIKKELDKFSFQYAQIIFKKMVEDIAMIMMKDIGFIPDLIIKRSVRNWGYCKTKERLIMLNISLIHVRKELIEYVIYHEMSHFVYQNHSKNFHNFLMKYLPDERKRKKELKNYSIVY